MDEEKIKFLEKEAHRLRNLVFDNCFSTKTGHIASAFSCSDILIALYYGNILKHDPKNPKLEERDRFILSKGHASPILYNILGDRGFFPKEWLNTSCQIDGKIGVHLQSNIPGVEITSGSLGHGLGIGIGIALAAKMDLKSYFTFVLLGDGESYEGSVWESIMFAGKSNLNNLVVIVDRNGIGASDFTENGVGLEPFAEKWESFGWKVKIVDGHSFGELLKAFEDIRSLRENRPLVIIAKTIKGKGIPSIENNPDWHGRLPDLNNVNKLKDELIKCQK